METKAGPVAGADPGRSDPFFRARPLKLLMVRSDDLDFFPPSPAPNVSMPKPVGGGGGGRPEIHIKVEYQDGGEQTQLDGPPVQLLHDDDVNLSARWLSCSLSR